MSTNPSLNSDSDPDTTIQRILFLSPRVHIYTVPPLTSTKGYTTTAWTPFTTPPPHPTPITCRLRVIETSSSSPPPAAAAAATNTISTEILLEDADSAALFAACPYTSPPCVEPTLDSARFFALTVQGEGGRKAVLGVGFEERGEGCEFVDVLRGARRVMGWGEEGGWSSSSSSSSSRGGMAGGGGGARTEPGRKKDWSLKDGEMIRVEIGGVSGKGEKSGGRRDGDRGEGGEGALFSIKPPPPPGGGGEGEEGLPLLPPPPSAKEVKAERRRSRGTVAAEKGSAAELGFDDGEFGEFQ
ncbi:MAG: hypothetical protein LQ345_002762 [Seirophora villosa]|nr:MAG: hypothetical protein LQ345_002762 [Seirophora villosa]